MMSRDHFTHSELLVNNTTVNSSITLIIKSGMCSREIHALPGKPSGANIIASCYRTPPPYNRALHHSKLLNHERS